MPRLTIEEVSLACDMRPSSIYYGMKRRAFPRPVARETGRCGRNFWEESHIASWVAAREAQRNAGRFARACARCRVVKSPAEYRSPITGRICLACQRAAHHAKRREWGERNRAQRAVYQSIYHASHRQEALAAKARYREKHGEAIAASKREYVKKLSDAYIAKCLRHAGRSVTAGAIRKARDRILAHRARISAQTMGPRIPSTHRYCKRCRTLRALSVMPARARLCAYCRADAERTRYAKRYQRELGLQKALTARLADGYVHKKMKRVGVPVDAHFTDVYRKHLERERLIRRTKDAIHRASSGKARA